MLNIETIQSLIDSGEGYNAEFKIRIPSKVRELTEEVCAFANADGGYLLFGIDDDGHIIGAGLENDKRSAIQGSISEISPAFHCELYAVNIEDKAVWVNVPSLSQACPKLEARYIVIAKQVIAFCSEPHSIQEIMDIVGQTNQSRLKKNIINFLIEAGILSMTIPNKPNSPLRQYSKTKTNQKY